MGITPLVGLLSTLLIQNFVIIFFFLIVITARKTVSFISVIATNHVQLRENNFNIFEVSHRSNYFCHPVVNFGGVLRQLMEVVLRCMCNSRYRRAPHVSQTSEIYILYCDGIMSMEPLL